MIKTFKDLIVWQKAHDLVLKIYNVTGNYPASEKFGLVSQLRRAAVSVPTNIVEGFKRKTDKDNANFVNIAEGSLEEMKYLIMLSSDLGYMDSSPSKELLERCEEIGKMLSKIYRQLKYEN